MNARHVLVLGGARSGKTAFAERLALGGGSRPLYLATAQVLDAEMADRVARHRGARQGRFDTLEEPLDILGALERDGGAHDVVLLDCMTLWISNLLLSGRNVAGAVDALANALVGMGETRVILVSNEVGMGIVPDNALSRSFRDLAGSAHQRLAEICADVYLIVAGLPLTVKGLAPGAN